MEGKQALGARSLGEISLQSAWTWRGKQNDRYMGGVKYMLEADSRRESSIGGDRALELLIRDLIPAGEKEQLLRPFYYRLMP